jgi:competence ComEA-like helix-hairpin-helix protein
MLRQKSVAMACVCGASVAAMWTSGPGLRARQELPEGPGRAVTQRLCETACHDIDKVTDVRRSKAQWVESIADMQARGAVVSDEEFKTVMSYLAAHFGVPVKINEATARQIDDVLDLASGQAEAIVKYRDAHGKFANWQDLMKVPGLDPKKLEEQKPNVVF